MPIEYPCILKKKLSEYENIIYQDRDVTSDTRYCCLCCIFLKIVKTWWGQGLNMCNYIQINNTDLNYLKYVIILTPTIH